MTIQIRGEEYGLNWVDSLEEALAPAQQHDDIWKISFDLNSGRVRLVRLGEDLWYLDQMKKAHYPMKAHYPLADPK